MKSYNTTTTNADAGRYRYNGSIIILICLLLSLWMCICENADAAILRKFQTRTVNKNSAAASSFCTEGGGQGVVFDLLVAQEMIELGPRLDALVVSTPTANPIPRKVALWYKNGTSIGESMTMTTMMMNTTSNNNSSHLNWTLHGNSKVAVVARNGFAGNFTSYNFPTSLRLSPGLYGFYLLLLPVAVEDDVCTSSIISASSQSSRSSSICVANGGKGPVQSNDSLLTFTGYGVVGGRGDVWSSGSSTSSRTNFAEPYDPKLILYYSTVVDVDELSAWPSSQPSLLSHTPSSAAPSQASCLVKKKLCKPFTVKGNSCVDASSTFAVTTNSAKKPNFMPCCKPLVCRRRLVNGVAVGPKQCFNCLSTGMACTQKSDCCSKLCVRQNASSADAGAGADAVADAGAGGLSVQRCGRRQ